MHGIVKHSGVDWVVEAINGAEYLASIRREPYAVVNISGNAVVTTLRSAKENGEEILEVCNP